MYAMIWLFVGGTYLFANYFVISNPQDLSYFYSQFMFTLVPMSYLAIDAFLLISATVNAYHLIKVEEFTAAMAIRHLMRRFFRNMVISLTIMFTAYVAMGRLV